LEQKDVKLPEPKINKTEEEEEDLTSDNQSSDNAKSSDLTEIIVSETETVDTTNQV